MPEPATHVEIRTGAYADSVTLLQVSKAAAGTPGVAAAQVAMGTPLNLEVLSGMGFDVPPCTANDMVVALRLQSPEALEPALATVAAALQATPRAEGAGEIAPPRTLGSALVREPADLALISVPGAFAFVEAMDALDADRDVMLFSDNVPVAQEVRLKQVATERGLLVMGPDCGTAMVGGVGLGFANVTRPGSVGMVAASGTGSQQLMCLLDAAGVGLSAVLGVGGHDLSVEVGGLSTREALRRLDADPAIDRILVVSKPPAPAVAAEVEALAAALDTPVSFALLGPGRPDLTEAAEAVLAELGVPVPVWPTWGKPATPNGGRVVRGLFVGGTLAAESALLIGSALGEVRDDLAGLTSDRHAVVDFGDDALTQGRAHPMIDPTLRLEQLAAAAAAPGTGVLLLDVVLGHCAESDPAAALAPVLAGIRNVPVVVACVGTEADPQQLSRQAGALADAGAEVFLSNAAATRRAIELVGART